jgi:hypothetical protein
MKVFELTDPAFSEAMHRLLAVQVPINTALKLRSLYETYNSVIGEFEMQKSNLIKELCDKGDDGLPKADYDGNVQFSKENAEKFASKVENLLNIEVSLPILSSDDLFGIRVSGMDVYLLRHIIHQ